ncbi:hypothetical protein D9O40_09870 [Clostridium autoethanogenum]|uniref:Uncharacterized protein n=1 Tax=Clostridium autoethanogenum TaxID=84023 RepID=A0A3M0SQ48_9CLOT|nr:hypothetical protein [Clostridium autoethanogenum]RMD00460.1 hypothetical protein D9O40_09870 [Clostridium autoethanogenum]
MVFTVIDPGGSPIPDSNITVTNVADKTYTYSVKVDPSAFKGNVNYTLSVKTIYKNGKTAGQTHTSAPDQKQNIHVAYVNSFEYSNFTFGAYDRNQNQYPYSYDLIKVWDDGTKTSKGVTGTVSGEGSVSILGEDPTYDGGPANVGNQIPPVNIKSFEIKPIVDSDWSWSDNKYNLSFTVIKNLSNGQIEENQESISIDPSTTYTYTAKDGRSPDYSQDFTFTAPAAPTPVVSDVLVEPSSISSRWTGNDANGGNVQENYTLTYKINGQSFSKYLSTNFTKGTGYSDQNLLYTVAFNGEDVNVSYTLPYIQPVSTDINTSNAGSGSNDNNGKGSH